MQMYAKEWWFSTTTITAQRRITWNKLVKRKDTLDFGMFFIFTRLKKNLKVKSKDYNRF